MSPQTGPVGPNMRFNGPNQGPPPQRPPFMGPPGPGMDGPPMGMQGPPPMVSGPGLMGPGPAPMMSGPAMPGPGMQGPPMGQPMSQAAALVGAILRAAPMLQQYRGPGPQGPNTTMSSGMPGDPRFMGPNMIGPGSNMDGPNMLTPPPNMGTGGAMMSPGQEGLMGDNQQQHGMMGMGHSQPMMMNQGHGSMLHSDDADQQQQIQQNNLTNPNIGQMSGGGNVRDPRQSGSQNDPRLNRGEQGMPDADMRLGQGEGHGQFVEEDFRRDVDMRHEEIINNHGKSRTYVHQYFV